METDGNDKKAPLTHRAKTQQNAAKKGDLTPWLDEDGKERPDDEIRVLGRKWSAKTWERYLDRDLKVELDEKNVFTFPYMDTSRIMEAAELLEFFRECRNYPKLEFAFFLAMEELTPNRSAIIKGLYWEGKDVEEIAKELGTTPATIRADKSRALKKLRELVPSKKFGERIERKINLEKLNKEVA